VHSSLHRLGPARHDVTRSRLILLLLSVAMAGAALAGCGGAEQDPQTVLARTFGPGTPPIHSGRLDLHLDVDGQGLTGLPAPLGVRLSGPFAGGKGGGVPKFDLALDLRTSGGTVRVGGISTGDRGWLVLQDQAYTLTPGLFRRLDRSRRSALQPSGRAAASTPLRAVGIDPRAWVRDPRTVGDETLAGEQVTHVRAGLDVPRLLGDVQRLLARAARGGAQAPPTLTPKARKAIQDAVRDARLDVWSGKDDHVLRRIALDVRYVAHRRPGRLRFGMGISAVNKAQPIGPPAGARPLGELSATLQQIVTTLQKQQAAGVAGAQGDAYQRCLATAAGDLAVAQTCAALVGR
jgi:hypothetical protein